MPRLNKKTISLLLSAVIALLGASGLQHLPQAPTTHTKQSGATHRAPLPKPDTYYKVVRVVDGDTIDVEIESVKVRVRLIGLNTPESVDPRRPVQCFGKEASAHAKEILTGKTVRLEMDPSQAVHDKYERLLAYVFLEDGTNFNERMIREGYGNEYTYDLPYKYQTEFKKAEAEARAEGLGLWSKEACKKE